MRKVCVSWARRVAEAVAVLFSVGFLAFGGAAAQTGAVADQPFEVTACTPGSVKDRRCPAGAQPSFDAAGRCSCIARIACQPSLFDYVTEVYGDALRDRFFCGSATDPRYPQYRSILETLRSERGLTLFLPPPDVARRLDVGSGASCHQRQSDYVILATVTRSVVEGQTQTRLLTMRPAARALNRPRVLVGGGRVLGDTRVIAGPREFCNGLAYAVNGAYARE